MSKSREELHEVLVNILGSRNVYFQPPESVRLEYPCIVYERSAIYTYKADNEKYLKNKQYNVTVIDEDPDSEIIDRMMELDYCRFNRHYVADNLNHDVFVVYY